LTLDDLVAACRAGGDIVAAVASFDDVAMLDPAETFVAYEDDALKVVLLSTPPQEVREPHEHQARVVSRMIVGDEDIMRFERADGGSLRRIDGFRLGQDEVTIHPPGVIHSAGNPGELPSLGLHVFWRQNQLGGGWQDSQA
jgi:hypothetical protein